LQLVGAQNLLREREEVSERPHQTHALEEIQVQETGTDWGLQLKDSTEKFVNPHREIPVPKSVEIQRHKSVKIQAALIFGLF